METQEVHVGRGVQGRRDFPGSCHFGTGHSDSGRPGDIRHGRIVAATDMAIQSSVRQTDRRLVAGTRNGRFSWQVFGGIFFPLKIRGPRPLWLDFGVHRRNLDFSKGIVQNELH